MSGTHTEPDGPERVLSVYIVTVTPGFSCSVVFMNKLTPEQKDGAACGRKGLAFSVQGSARCL